MLIGICGKPSVGKSTFFSALTLIDVPISPRPFTTVTPNKGIAFVRAKCPCSELHVKCNPLNSKCEDGIRYVPVNVVDLAGLVPGAHAGKGLGNKFLDEIRQADALIQVVDASGKTDELGNACDFYDPANEIVFLEEEIVLWLNGIISRAWGRIKGKNIQALMQALSGVVPQEKIEIAVRNLALPTKEINWSVEDIKRFAQELRKVALPIIIAANKIDLPSSRRNYEMLKEKFADKIIIPTYADGELALRRAQQKGIVNYKVGEENFEVLECSESQKIALEKIAKALKENKGTRVQEVLEKVVFEILQSIIVYPVSDENKYCDHYCNVLPDAIIMQKGSTALDLAATIHTDLAKNFIFAIDARKKIRVGKEHKLNDGDVIRIVAGKG